MEKAQNPNMLLDEPKDVVEEVINLANTYWNVWSFGVTKTVSQLSQVGSQYYDREDIDMIIRFFNTPEGIELAAYHEAAITTANKAMLNYLFKEIPADPIKYQRLAPKYVKYLLNRGNNAE